MTKFEPAGYYAGFFCRFILQDLILFHMFSAESRYFLKK